jgi:DNA-binding XRE family transcriptional regulator
MQVKKLKIKRVAEISEKIDPLTKSRSHGKCTVDTSVNIKKGLGNRLQSWRKNNGYTLHGLARKIGVTVGPLSEIENSKNLPSLETVAALHNHTNLNILWLLFKQGSSQK